MAKAARTDLLIHLKLSDNSSRTQGERDALFRLDADMAERFGDRYDGNDIGQGEFVLHFVPQGDAGSFLVGVMPAVQSDLVRGGSYAVVRTEGRDEDIETIVALAGEPEIVIEEKDRKALSFGMARGGTTADTQPLNDYIDGIWKQIRDMPNRPPDSASLIVIWHIGGDVYSPAQLRERVKVAVRSERVLGTTVEIPRSVAADHDPRLLVQECLDRVMAKCKALVKRQKIDWSLEAITEAISLAVA